MRGDLLFRLFRLCSRCNRDEEDCREIIVFKRDFFKRRVYPFRDTWKINLRASERCGEKEKNTEEENGRERDVREEERYKEKRARRDTSGGKRRAGANLACQEVAYSSRTKASRGTRARLEARLGTKLGLLRIEKMPAMEEG